MSPKLRSFSLATSLAFGALTVGCFNTNVLTPADSNDTTSDTSNTTRSLTGVIVAPESAKAAARMQNNAGLTYSVMVHGVETLKTYPADTDPNGRFSVEIPDDEQADTFMVTVLKPDGQPGGPVVFNTDGDLGYTGLEFTGAANLGTVAFPDDPTQSPIAPGTDATYDPNWVSASVTARLTGDGGAPVGVADFGRGDAARGDASSDPLLALDADRDGMVAWFDADDDGDGTIDDLDTDATLLPGLPAGLIINFFMNLKISDDGAVPYFTGDTAGIETSLREDTVITFEVIGDPTVMGKSITGVRVIAPPAPAPSYLTAMTILGGGATPKLWSSTSYALDPDGPDHFQAFAVPNDFMNTGDTFTVEITYDDGSVDVFPRMINYVFKSIPRIEQVGDPNALVAVAGPGTITFDGTKDLAFEFDPPVDDFGMLLTGLPYAFEVFYYDASNNQINDIQSTSWATTISGFDTARQVFEVPGSALTTPVAGRFTVVLPHEIFVNSVDTPSGPVAVSHYKVDIAAQNNGNNSALMLQFTK